MLTRLFSTLDERALPELVARPRGPLRDMVASAELDEFITPDRQFRSVRKAVEFYRVHLGPR